MKLRTLETQTQNARSRIEFSEARAVAVEEVEVRQLCSFQDRCEQDR